MKKLLLTLALCLLPTLASAQCNGVFAAHTVCGNNTASPAIPSQVPQASIIGPGGSNGQVQFNNNGFFDGYTNTQLTALINAFTSGLSGAVPASGGGTTNFLRADGTFAPLSSGGGLNGPQGRLTLLTGTPVMASSNTSQTTLFYDCSAGGNSVPVYNGSADVALPITGCEISTAMQSSGTGILGANNVFDVWGINVTGALQICVATNGSGGGGAGWAGDTGGSNTARGTGYSQLDSTTRSYITNKNAITVCVNGTTNRGTISANQATYLGTILTDAASAGQVSFTLGSFAAGGGAARIGIWNAYNRVPLRTTVQNSDASWTYAVAGTWRAADVGSTTFRVTSVYGANVEAADLTYSVLAIPGAATSTSNGIGVDSTTTLSGAGGFFTGTNTTSLARLTTYPGTGLHFFSALEWNSNTTTSTWISFVANQANSGLIYVGSY